MKKNKNIKSQNLKLSNFVMKLGMVSAVAGTIASSVAISQVKKNEVIVVENNSEQKMET